MKTTIEQSKKNNHIPVQLKMKIVKYVIVCSFLAIVNYITSPSYWWVLWVVAGWGINLGLTIFSHYIIKKEEEKK